VYRPAICLPDGDTIHVGGEFEFNSRFLTGLVEAPREGAIFLVTIGADLEQSIREEIEHGRNRNAFILDCLGSSAAEGAANALHRNIQRRFGLRMRRYSPGYNDWDVSEQRVLFEFLGRENAGQIGVELTPDFMMTPRKSVSGIILPRSRIRPARINPTLVPGIAET
jgi:hypothetical protein